MEKNTIAVSASSLRDGRKKISEELTKHRLSSKEITLGALLMEEIFFRLKKGMNGGEDFSVKVSARHIWGQTSIRMEAKGSEYNPVPEVTEQEEDDVDEEDIYRLAILKSNRQKLSCVRKNGTNIVTIKVQGLDSTKKQLIYTVSALVLGSICGLAMQVFLDGASIAAISNNVIAPVRNLFLNALHMMMAPVTFFAIIAGVTNISDAALIGKLGGKMVMVSLFMQVLIALLGLGLGILIFTGDLSYIQAGITSTGETVTKHVSLIDMLFDIVPKNLVDPFKGDNILQVMFLAVFFGIIINQMGEKAKGAIDSIGSIPFHGIASGQHRHGLPDCLQQALWGTGGGGAYRVGCVCAGNPALCEAVACPCHKEDCRIKSFGIHGVKLPCEAALCAEILCRKARHRRKAGGFLHPCGSPAQQGRQLHFLFAGYAYADAGV